MLGSQEAAADLSPTDQASQKNKATLTYGARFLIKRYKACIYFKPRCLVPVVRQRRMSLHEKHSSQSGKTSQGQALLNGSLLLATASYTYWLEGSLIPKPSCKTHSIVPRACYQRVILMFCNHAYFLSPPLSPSPLTREITGGRAVGKRNWTQSYPVSLRGPKYTHDDVPTSANESDARGGQQSGRGGSRRLSVRAHAR